MAVWVLFLPSLQSAMLTGQRLQGLRRFLSHVAQYYLVQDENSVQGCFQRAFFPLLLLFCNSWLQKEFFLGGSSFMT